MSKNIMHVFIIGSKGIPAQYGGFESFVDKLTFYRKAENIQYNVACAIEPSKFDATKKEFTYNNARCFGIKLIRIGPARAIIYDISALKESISYVKKNHIENPIFYILACRIGPFIGHFKRKINKLGGILLVNPDGHEWKRAKWAAPIRAYWKNSEKLMVKHSDLLVCDSKAIEEYIRNDYKEYKPKTTFIAYGAETQRNSQHDSESKFLNWCQEKGIIPKDYYLVVGRFVPENNFETMIREFMLSSSTKNFVLITGTDGNKFYKQLKAKTHFDKDLRIKFVGTVYDKDLLSSIRASAYGYFHGHEVGGTNPSLLESMGSTDLNMLLDVCFNQEVGGDSALYWTKDQWSLARLINYADNIKQGDIVELGVKAKKRIMKEYSWEYIVKTYEDVFYACFRKSGK